MRCCGSWCRSCAPAGTARCQCTSWARRPPPTCSTPSRCCCSATARARSPSWHRSSAGRSRSGGSGSTGGQESSTHGRCASCSPPPSEGHPQSMPAPEELPEHVTAPLLTVLTQRSLDEDYQHVADARRADGTSGGSRKGVAIVVALFGLLIVTAAVQTSRDSA